MEQTLYKKLKDDAFQAKTQQDWDMAMQAIKEAVKDDASAAESLRKYCKSILPKKKEWFEKQKAKPQWTAKPKMMFTTETDAAIGELARTMNEYFKKLINN